MIFDSDFPVNNTEPRLFRHVTYNIDGLCEKNLTLRIKAICEILIREKVTIAFLQEVRSNSEEIIRENLEPSYEIFSGYNSSADYYTLTLIAKKPYIRVIQSEVINFKQTQMGRNILLVELRIDDAKLLLINTHLESTKESKSIRMQQLVKLFQILQKKDLKELSIIVAGDLNLRDKEVLDEIGGLPSGVVDAWIATGKRPEVQYTWDMRRNDNEKFYEKNTNFKPRMRFDRVFFRPSQPTKIDLIHFGLIGLERLKPHTCFPSDHWGVITSYQIYLNKI
ncbi:tyrosyl-DNA phosphodiesterase 2-like protein [Sarcoptes scabiei]|uniref:Tyrosyl-DNA phosphodiesterase 2-like protein n=1 Tax=Sarcoptes scabiei TaxID=52283 RepID=A0A132A922_SARSC|nr:tyrosyl-DNA phosphodiesterase 2-like protein [Sarcoptes scabiei]